MPLLRYITQQLFILSGKEEEQISLYFLLSFPFPLIQPCWHTSSSNPSSSAWRIRWSHYPGALKGVSTNSEIYEVLSMMSILGKWQMDLCQFTSVLYVALWLYSQPMDQMWGYIHGICYPHNNPSVVGVHLGPFDSQNTCGQKRHETEETFH